MWDREFRPRPNVEVTQTSHSASRARCVKVNTRKLQVLINGVLKRLNEIAQGCRNYRVREQAEAGQPTAALLPLPSRDDRQQQLPTEDGHQRVVKDPAPAIAPQIDLAPGRREHQVHADVSKRVL